MAYSDFTLRGITQRFGLEILEVADLFAAAPEAGPSRRLEETLAESLPPAQDNNTGKARSGWIIAPRLPEVHSRLAGRVSMFSGVEFSVDAEQGLTGVCDSLLSRSPQQLFISVPLVAIVEAKNEDIRAGIPQCAAETVAARLFNERGGSAVRAVFGAVTTGTLWRFLRLEGPAVAVDQREYHVVERLAKTLGIFLSMFGADPGLGASVAPPAPAGAPAH
jgi:hypothetical protein